jgi:hypothetical protein
LLAVTTDSAPTRSPYSEKDFENELDDEELQARCGKQLARQRILSMPSAKPW